MPVDPYWERIRLAFDFENEKWSRNWIWKRGLKKTDERGRDDRFLPGQILYVKGSISGSWFDYLERQGYTLLDRELRERQSAAQNNQNYDTGKYCVVVDRLGTGRYIVCHLTTFARSLDPKNITSPLGRFFSLAVEDTPGWPVGMPSLRTNPKWNGGAFVVALPVVREYLLLPTGLPSRFALWPGELHRLRRFIFERGQVSCLSCIY
jgi:hypothetical protein